MRKSIITTLVVSIICLLTGGVLIGVSMYQMTNPYVYSYDIGDGFFSYTMKYATNIATGSVYYEHLFALGGLLFLSGVILVTGALIAHSVITRNDVVEPRMKRTAAPKAAARPVDIPLMDETPAPAEDVKPEEN